ncbi:sigma-54 interaction domain-containing protein [Chondromyces crocatus]|uniref:ATPase AAA n=1 Tax=Chondromyces crocatus TaxID=52 RepID=A0A0K1EDZ0_CHOCO|nr:sigma-54-dependent Fis family transcriptional regulator [Chondromyces crocatus]AKT38917.1 ATPase AAA [Chondromyces crocatus]
MKRVFRERGEEGGQALQHALGALEALAGPTLLLDERGRVSAVGPEARGLLPREVGAGQRLHEIFVGAADELHALLRSQREGMLSLRSRGEREALRPFRVRATPRTAEGRALGWTVHLSSCAATEDRREERFHGMWTQDPRMRRLFRIVEKAAKTQATVLLRGESGTGKERVACALHALSPRAHGPFRAINCAALAPTLLESELFGHVRGAFTGAVRDSPGHFRLAQGGTLFLDEVAEMPPELQAKMLRVLETHTIIPVGGREPVSVDVRIISATHRALRREVEQGRFRADLMYRLRVVPIFLPALRERPGDILPLAEQFLAEFNAQGGRQVKRIAPRARRQMEEYPWPGNVRELRNAMEYAHVMGERETLTEADLPPEFNEQARPVRLPLSPASVTTPASEVEAHSCSSRASRAPPREVAPGETIEVSLDEIRRALALARGRRAHAAELLGISRVTLWRRLKEAEEDGTA